MTLQVELFGGARWHVDRQGYRAGISYIKVVGTPLHNFAAHTSTPDVSLAGPGKLGDLHNSVLPRSFTDQSVSGVHHAVVSGSKQGFTTFGAVLQYIHPDPQMQAKLTWNSYGYMYEDIR